MSDDYEPQSAVAKWIDKRLPIITLFSGHLMQFPTPKNLNYWWTFGGILTFCLITQIITGLVLAMHYIADANLAFASVSIDSYKERDEYIRFPTNFKQVESTLHLLDNTPDNIHVSIATAVQIFNIKTIPEFIKWKVNSNFKKMNVGLIDGHIMGGGLLNAHLVHIPTFLNITILPEKDKQEVREKFAELKQWLWNNFTQDDEFWKHNPKGWRQWEGLLKHMDSCDNSHMLPGFKEYVNKLDAIRGLNAASVFPELSHLL